MGDKFVLIWGAGRIGRGFVADLFDAAGYQLTLVDQSVELVAQLRRAGQFTVVRAANAEERHDQIISGYTALSTTETDEIATAVAAADSLVVAVYPQDFPQVARQLVPGLTRRQAKRPDAALDIILCTNLAHAAVQFEAQLREGHIGVKPGWVRFSFSPVTSEEDMTVLLEGVEHVVAEWKKYEFLYQLVDETGEYTYVG